MDPLLDAVVGRMLDGTITSWNGAATRLFGYSEQEALGSSISLIIPREHRNEVVRTTSQVLRGERVSPFESIRVTKDGRRLPVMVAIQPLQDSDGRIVGSTAVFRDIGELRRAESRFRAAFESSPSGMVMVSRSGRIVLVNEEVVRLFGYAREELTGQPVELLVPERFRGQHPGLRTAFVARPEKRAMGAGRELFARRKDGSEVLVEIGLTPVETEEGFNVIAAITDVSLRKHVEQLREASRRSDQFLHVLSHELRESLASLRMCVNLLETQGREGPRFGEAAEVAERQFERLASLVNQLLDASLVEAGKIVLDRKHRDFVEVVRTSVADQRSALQAATVGIVLQLPAEPLWVSGDPLRLSQIVLNLLSNAIRFSPEGGRVTVTLRHDVERKHAELSVRDEGIGIEPQLLPLLFQPFTHVTPVHGSETPGLGLGLSLVQALVTAHGGTVEARSEGKNRGAEFIVRLPLVDAPTAARAPSKPAARASRTPRRILVVEETRDTSLSLRWLLEAHGHEVEVAEDGPAAMATAERFRPEVVLCDIALPGGMDGYQVAAALRGDHAAGPPYLIAVTGYGSAEDRARALEAGFDHHFTKAGDPQLLTKLIADLPR